MKNLKAMLILFLISTINIVSAQGKYGEIGKLYAQEEALELYGPVLESVEIPTHELVSMLDYCENYMMFTIKNGELIIADDYRNVLTRHKIQLTSEKIESSVNQNEVIDDEEVLNAFSKSKVFELIEKSGSKELSFERREKVYTIGSIWDIIIILELSRPCPPFCG